MDAKADSKSKLPERQAPALSARAFAVRDLDSIVAPAERTSDAASQWRSLTQQSRISSDRFVTAAVFKKTPCVADLQSAGRDVAKDKADVGNIPLLMKTQLDQGFLRGDRPTNSGRTIVEGGTFVTWTLHRELVRQTQRSVVLAGSVGPNGNLAPEGAIWKVAGMSKLPSSWPARWLERDHAVPMRAQDAVAAPIDYAAPGAAVNTNLTDDLVPGPSEWTARATDDSSDALSEYALQVGHAFFGAMTRPGGAVEKHCYADV
ncbi:dihydroxy-acid dehydratase domain-containing protein [Rhodopseudomonas telluris]|uniref:Dihydroxy-acid dehydratase n=1 Tax=Rhodopseudomonas telluris TaxID=644215 RepID=A0ABV6EXH7_9BRAD